MGKRSSPNAQHTSRRKDGIPARKHHSQKNMRQEIGLHLQQVHEAIVALNMAIASLPVSGSLVVPEVPLLLSPLVSSVAQPLVDLIGQVLQSRRVALLAVGPAGQLSSIAGSGFTAEQEQIMQAL